MATTAREVDGKVCLLVMVNSCGSQFDRCLTGECSAWEWDAEGETDGKRPGHCVVAGRAALPQVGKKKRNRG
jgi:hypothetical protein